MGEQLGYWAWGGLLLHRGGSEQADTFPCQPVLCCRCHRGAITGLATSPDGHFLFSSCSQGTLAQYRCAAAQCHVLRVAGVTGLLPQAPLQPLCPVPRGRSDMGLHQLLKWRVRRDAGVLALNPKAAVPAPYPLHDPLLLLLSAHLPIRPCSGCSWATLKLPPLFWQLTWCGRRPVGAPWLLARTAACWHLWVPLGTQ